MKKTCHEPNPVRKKHGINYFIMSLCVLLFTCICVCQGFANITPKTAVAIAATPVSGKVVDSKGQPLAGVSVKENGTSNGTVTDSDGNFRLNVSGPSSVLTFSFVGYLPQEVHVRDQTSIQITLAETNSKLDDVVVVGYTTQKRSAITGAISSVKGSDLAKAPVDNITNSLAGQVSGVITRQYGGGEPGNDNTTIHIRGINSIPNPNFPNSDPSAPLIVIDGIIRNNLNQIDPNEIESVTILKDAAAVAPYGLGGANGVVLITTKTGKNGPPSLSLAGYYGHQAPTYYPKVLGPQDYMTLYDEAQTNDNVAAANLAYAPGYISSYLTNHAKDPDRYPIGNGRSIVNFKAPEQNYNLDLSGGSDRVRYYTNLGYFNQAGMFAPISYTRYSYNLGMEVSATSSTKVSISLKGAFEKSTDVDAAISNSTIFRDSYKLIPINPLQFSNGDYGSSQGLSLLGALNSGGYSHTYTNTLLSTLAIEQRLPIKGLSIKGTLSYDPTSTNQKQWHLPFYYYTINTSSTPYVYTKAIATAEGPPAYTYLYEQYLKSENFTYQGILTYNNTFGKNSVSGLIVAEARNNINSNFNARINNYSLQVAEFNFGSSNKNDYSIGGTSGTASQVGYVYTVGDVWDGKYSLAASGRYDGHYYFAPGHQYAFFPAFSGFWNIARENFMKNVSWVDDFKLRASWGKSGSLAGGPYQYQNAYNLIGDASAYGNGVLVQGTSPTNQANPFITWEQAVKTDIGFDASFLNRKLNVTIDVYKQNRSGILAQPTTILPGEYGTVLSQVNDESMEGQGIELTVGTRHQFASGLQLTVNGTFSYNTNKLTQVYETAATFDNPNRRVTGRPVNTQFGYHAMGLFQKSDDKNGDGVINGADGYTVNQFNAVLRPGDIKYEDVNHDGKIDANDIVPIGNSPVPLIDYGLNLNASWKGFDLSLFFQGAAKSTINVQSFITIPFDNNSSNTGYEYFDNRWTPSHPNAKYPIADVSPSSNNTQASDFWNRNASYVRLKTAQLGYSIPPRILKRISIKAFRVYVSGQNLLTLSPLKFMDPELGGVNTAGQIATGQEVIYPIQRVITVGFSATF
jgi:TonB-linked SusC/RagA family outer membrane protein